MEKFSTKMIWVATDSWRGYEKPVQAVCGANDTGTWEDSPCPSPVRKREIDAVKQLFKKAGIKSRQMWARSSNVFCQHCYLIVLPSQQEDARKIVQDYLDNNETDLLYIC